MQPVPFAQQQQQPPPQQPLPQQQQQQQQRFSSRSPLSGRLERASILYYRVNQKRWEEGQVTVRVAVNPFSTGGIRAAHHCHVYSGQRTYESVVKIPRGQQSEAQNFADVEMQEFSQVLASKFSETLEQLPETLQHPERVRSVRFVDAFVLRFHDRPGQPAYSAEVLIKGGEYVKYNDNAGYVNSALIQNEAPQAFSHWSFEYSGRRLVVVDIQGVRSDRAKAEYWTDPQVHTTDQKGYGTGNLGQHGIDRFFMTHTCNALCRDIGLPPCRARAQSNPQGGIMPMAGAIDQISVGHQPNVHVVQLPGPFMGNVPPAHGGAYQNQVAPALPPAALQALSQAGVVLSGSSAPSHPPQQPSPNLASGGSDEEAASEHHAGFFSRIGAWFSGADATERPAQPDERQTPPLPRPHENSNGRSTPESDFGSRPPPMQQGQVPLLVPPSPFPAQPTYDSSFPGQVRLGPPPSGAGGFVAAGHSHYHVPPPHPVMNERCRVNPRSLPNSWTMGFDQNKRRFYFIDHSNRRTTFEPPPDVVLLPDSWEMLWDANAGRTYFYNTSTQGSTYDPPELVQPAIPDVPLYGPTSLGATEQQPLIEF